MEYAIQYPDWQYVVGPTSATVEDIASVISSHPWEDGLAMFERLGGVDKMSPTLDAGDDSRESAFFCACVQTDLFDVSVCLAPAEPRSKLALTLMSPFRKGRFVEFPGQTAEQAIEILRTWASTADSELEHVLKQHKGAPTTASTATNEPDRSATRKP